MRLCDSVLYEDFLQGQGAIMHVRRTRTMIIVQSIYYFFIFIVQYL